MRTLLLRTGTPGGGLFVAKAVLIALALIGCLYGHPWAFTINSQGAAGAPVSVTNAVKVVIPCSTSQSVAAGRTQWLICPETVSIRCTTGPVAPGCGVASPAPSSSVGFLIAAGSCWKGDYPAAQGGGANITGIYTAEVDCFSTAGATSVDTVEFP